jgi:hypothetical protein
MTLRDYVLRGGPKDGCFVRAASPFAYLMFPDAVDGMHWYECQTHFHAATGKDRDVMVYIGKSLDGKKPGGSDE